MNETMRRRDGGDVDDLGPWRFVRLHIDDGTQITLSNPKTGSLGGRETITGDHVQKNELHIIHVGRIKKIVELRASKKYGDLIAVEINHSE